MINRQQFNETFQHFDAETIVGVIDEFAEQQPEIIGVLQQNISDCNLVEIKKNAHKLKGTCAQLFDHISEKHAKRMEDAASRKIVELIEVMMLEFPEKLNALNEELDDSEIVYQVIFVSHSIKSFLGSVNEPLSAENESKLRDLEAKYTADGMPEMPLKLKISSTKLLEELLRMKKELISG